MEADCENRRINIDKECKVGSNLSQASLVHLKLN